MTSTIGDRRQPVLRGRYEFATDAELREAGEKLGYRVIPKVSMSEALRLDRSGLPSDEYSYALKATFDWVVADAQSTVSEFAVEFDGRSHRDARVQARDAMKNRICHLLGLPLLRIDDAVFRPIEQRSVIAYLVESWATYRAFQAGQNAGTIPADEIFVPWFVFERLMLATSGSPGTLVHRRAAPSRSCIAPENYDRPPRITGTADRDRLILTTRRHSHGPRRRMGGTS